MTSQYQLGPVHNAILKTLSDSRFPSRLRDLLVGTEDYLQGRQLPSGTLCFAIEYLAGQGLVEVEDLSNQWRTFVRYSLTETGKEYVRTSLRKHFDF